MTYRERGILFAYQKKKEGWNILKSLHPPTFTFTRNWFSGH